MMTKPRTVNRSAVTGKFVSTAYAKRNPKKTVHERIPPKKKKK